jgi:hypothetical protein
VRRGGLWLKVYEQSLGIAFALLFLLSIAGHAISGAAERHVGDDHVWLHLARKFECGVRVPAATTVNPGSDSPTAYMSLVSRSSSTMSTIGLVRPSAGVQHGIYPMVSRSSRLSETLPFARTG